MPEAFDDDPTVPPPGKRSGTGIWSIVPFLQKSLAVKPQVAPPQDYQTTVPQWPPRRPAPAARKPR